ncbi:MAG: acyl-CoA dehydrogenase family protein [Dehalococcoidia bacterium]
MTIDISRGRILGQDLLDRFGERAPVYDRENRFFFEDFEDLQQAGYLLMTVPTALGGHGMNLAEVAAEQRRLAYRAPATALATNMHLYWTGLAADMLRAGDDACRWMLEEAARGEVFAAGHGETGNDVPVLLSTARAERADGGYRFWGHKIFGSLTPVWTYLGIHAMDASDPERPRIVHAFMPRETAGYRIVQTWDTLGMRATRSDDTILEGAFVPDRYIPRILPAGDAADLFILTMIAWAEVTFANVYLGIAERARDLALPGLTKKTSIGLGGKAMAYNPMIQYAVAEMVIAIEAMQAHADRIAADWSAGVDYGAGWAAKLVALKHHCVESAKRVVDIAMDVSGGGAMFKRNELERLYRDVRCGGFHPQNSANVHEIVGKSALGILGELPRWG